MELNNKKIAFIVCINDMNVFSECRYYLEKLRLPDHFEKDIVMIYDAPSMAAGYNAGMASSDAKYKVYMHQDVLLINKDFISDICKVFEDNTDIGIIGCIGATKLGKEAMAITSWDTGKIMHNLSPMLMDLGEQGDAYTGVMALDGLLLATQYDIPWRDDIMDGWDFYDISQCMEFARAGYKAAVPRQENAWCYHDNTSSKMLKYNLYRRRFIDEYAKDGSFEMPAEWNDHLEYQKAKQQSVELMERLVLTGDRNQLREVFADAVNRTYIHLKEYELIADIDYLEERAGEKIRLWETGMDASRICQKIRLLKYWLKRIEYKSADTVRIMDDVIRNYSVYAVLEIFDQYIINKKYAYREIRQYYEQKNMQQEAKLLDCIVKNI